MAINQDDFDKNETRDIIVIKWKKEAGDEDKEEIINSLISFLRGYQFRMPIIESVSVTKTEDKNIIRKLDEFD